MSKRILILGGAGSGKSALIEALNGINADAEIVTLEEAQKLLQEKEDKDKEEEEELILKITANPYRAEINRPKGDYLINRSIKKGSKKSRRKNNFNHYS